MIDVIKVYDYSDYRAFLNDSFQMMKEESQSVSLSYIATKLNQSRMSVKYVLDAKRHVSTDKIVAYIKAFKLNHDEGKYFTELVGFNKAKSDEKKNQHFEKLLKLRNNHIKDHWLSHSEIGIFKDWFYTTISELTKVEGFKLDPEWIKKRLQFPVHKNDIEDTINYLQSINQIKEKGEIKEKLKYDSEFSSHIYKNYHHKQMELGRRSLREMSKDKREFFTLTVALDERRYNILKQRLEDFRHELHDLLADGDVPDRVVQVNLQSFITAEVGKS